MRSFTLQVSGHLLYLHLWNKDVTSYVSQHKSGNELDQVQPQDTTSIFDAPQEVIVYALGVT